MTKIRILAMVAILISPLVLAPNSARAEDWYQGRKGQWVQSHNAWQFHDSEGNIYRKHGNSWAWYNGRAHGAEGQAYHDRPAGDNQTYNQYQNSH